MSLVNKQAVAAAFGRAAQSYSQHDELQRLSARGLLAALGDGRFCAGARRRLRARRQ